MRGLLLVMMLSLLLLSGCGREGQVPAEPQIEPELIKIQDICNLATVECLYHNVAKATKEKDSGLINALVQKDRKFWIEYTSEAKIGIDMSQVAMTVEGDVVTITMPPAQLISCTVKQIDEEDYVVSEDGFFISNPITAKDQTEAIDQAQKELVEKINADQMLMSKASNRAKTMIENYVIQIGKANGVDYRIVWR